MSITNGRPCADPGVPPGYVLLRLDDLAALLSSSGQPDRADTRLAAEASALAAVVSLLTARQTGAQVSAADLMAGADEAAVLHLMTALAGAMLTVFPDRGTELLREIGAAAVMGRARPPDGRGRDGR